MLDWKIWRSLDPTVMAPAPCKARFFAVSIPIPRRPTMRTFILMSLAVVSAPVSWYEWKYHGVFLILWLIQTIIPSAAFCLENRFNSFADNGIDSVSVIVNSVNRSFFSGGKSDIEEVLNLFQGNYWDYEEFLIVEVSYELNRHYLGMPESG
jgi:hypothetical protein